jgi:subtilase family serine protease
VLGVPGIAQAASTAQVPGSVLAAAQAGTRLGAVPSSQQVTVQVWLTSNQADASAFASAVSTPGNALFHHYLSPAAYTARFGPTPADVSAVTAWLNSEGLTDVHAGSGRDYVSAIGPVSKVQAAFHVQIAKYRVKGADGKSLVIQSNDRDVSVPAALAPDVLAVTGLGNQPSATTQATPRSTAHSTAHSTAAATPACAQYWSQYVETFHPAYQGLTKGSLPVCGYSANQLRVAYGATMAATGKGQTVALIEDEAPIAMRPTLADYAKHNQLPAPTSGQFRQVQVTAGGTCDASASSAPSAVSAKPSDDADQMPYPDEAEMDSEAVYAMAPGADQLMVVGAGCDENQSLLDAALSVLTGNGAHPSATIESNSWQLPLGTEAPQTVHAIDLRAVAEGVGMYFASGDTPGLNVTDSDPDATAVGGTTLGIGAKNARLFETGWSDDYASLDGGKWTDTGNAGGSGGGATAVYPQPAYQKGVVPASMSKVVVGKKTVTGRAVPDIAADADTNTGMLTGYIGTGTDAKPGPYQTEVNGGTSLACPLVAGLVADAQQGQTSPFGFINPLIYGLAGTAAFHDALPITASTPQQNRDAYTPATASDSASVTPFDSQNPADTTQVTTKGYDTMTGLGTPDGGPFITALRKAVH